MESEHFFSLADPHFWVLISTIGFCWVVFKFGRAPVLGALDDRSSKIKAALEEAEKLKSEAQELLADVQKKHRDAIQTSQKIIDSARETAERLQHEAAQKLAESITRRETQLLERIRRAEAAAVKELRDQAADIAARSSELLLQDALAKRNPKLVDEAIAAIPGQLA
jgi:F-type H+-transporting ATPase subunit b